MKVSTSQIKVLDGQNRDNSDRSIIQSVGKEGVLVPLLVVNNQDGTFTLVAGHRRLASAIHFGIDMVPIQTIPADQAEKARALENLDRKGLHPMDEAAEIRTLQAQGYDNGVIGAMLGMDPGKLIRRSRLNNLTDTVRKAFIEGKMDAAAAEEYSVMPPEDQDNVYNRFAGGYAPSAKQIRSQYLGLQGISLGRCTDQFLKMEPKCKTCPNNIASDNVLFDGTDGTCRDVKCYCGKLEKLAESEKAQIYSDRYYKEDRILDQLKKDGVKPVKASQYNLSSSSYGNYTVKVADFWGNIRYDEAEEPKKKADPEAAKRRKEISKQYKSLYEQIQPALGKMLFEHAEAWLAKFHKDERFPDKDERVILAKALYGQTMWRLSGFIYGKQYYGNTAPLEGSDNKRIFSVMYLWASTGAEENQEIWPHKPEDGKELRLPKSMDLEDLFQLRTSKAKKKVLELKAEMDQLLAEYSALEGK